MRYGWRLWMVIKKEKKPKLNHKKARQMKKNEIK